MFHENTYVDNNLKNKSSKHAKGPFQWNLAQSWETWIHLHFLNTIGQICIKMAARTNFVTLHMLISVEMAQPIYIYFLLKVEHPIFRQLQKGGEMLKAF